MGLAARMENLLDDIFWYLLRVKASHSWARLNTSENVHDSIPSGERLVGDLRELWDDFLSIPFDLGYQFLWGDDGPQDKLAASRLNVGLYFINTFLC